jgi:limonene-1,2-epoxide hydrolase
MAVDERTPMPTATDRERQLELRAAAFFASWSTSFDGMCDGFAAEFDPACDWDQRPMWRTHSVDSALSFLRLARRALRLDTIDVELLSIAVNGDVVHTQRVDHLRRGDGSLIVSAPVAGVLTYRGHRIVVWKEYFDPTVMGAKTAWSMMRSLIRR